MYTVLFNGDEIYSGEDRSKANVIATAFAHAYSAFPRGHLELAVDLGARKFATAGTLGHDAIATVKDFFAHY